MMENKYYTPAIEEFHVGFEYEWNDPNEDDVWRKSIAEAEDCYHAVREITNNYGRNYRVKYLDREDIEECGWEYVEDDSVGDGNQRWYDLFTKDNYSLSSWYNIDGYESLNNKVKIMKKDNIIFDGYLKNKSEFKRILKQVGITKKGN